MGETIILDRTKHEKLRLELRDKRMLIQTQIGMLRAYVSEENQEAFNEALKKIEKELNEEFERQYIAEYYSIEQIILEHKRLEEKLAQFRDKPAPLSGLRWSLGNCDG